MNNPAIVIVAYNRPKSLKRLLGFIENAVYTEQNINLIISIDFQNSVKHQEVVELANSFRWDRGNKSVIEHTKNLGLRAHVLSCGDLSVQYGSVIVLEDDLGLSPYFYIYSHKTLEFYENDSRIAGISLYNHKRNFCAGLPFEILAEHSDNYFLQIASSWGQAWTKNQWQTFRLWYDSNGKIDHFDKIPSYVIQWPESSWLKYFIKYLVVTNKFFVYPKTSYSTNFGDAGTHNLSIDVTYQVPLSIEFPILDRLSNLDNSINIYDSHFELIPEIYNKLNTELKFDDVIIDTYGLKNLSLYTESYALSSKNLISKSTAPSFGLSLKPMSMNVILKITGNSIHFDQKSNFENAVNELIIQERLWNYFNGFYKMRLFIKLVYNKVRFRIKY